MNLKQTIHELYLGNQAKLLPEDQAAGDDQKLCDSEHDGYACTKAAGHKEKQHVAHGMLGGVVARWE